MKLRRLCTAALLTGLGVTMVAGDTAIAAPGSLSSQTTTTVGQGTTMGPSDPTPDPEIPGGEVPDIPGVIIPNPDKGSMAIERISVLQFDPIQTGSAEIIENAKEVSWTPAGGTEQKRGAFVVFNDVRANQVYGYTVSAKLTKQFALTTNPSVKLTNASIKYQNSHLDAVRGNTNLAPSTVQSSFELDDTNSRTVVTASKANNEGKGQYTLEFGRSDTYVGSNGTAGTAKESVQLVVPSGTASSMNLGDYKAEITWTIVAE